MSGKNNLPDPNQQTTRRGFLATGTGLIIAVSVAPLLAQEPEHLPTTGMGYPTDLNVYLKIGADGRVSGFAGKVELGQGATTSLAQLIAEELDVPLDSVDMTLGDTDLCPWDMGTFGSLNIWQFGPVMRRAAAEARAALLQMAAERFGSPVGRLRTANGVITDSGAPAKTITYAKLVEGKRIERHLQNVSQKNVGAFKVIGQSPKRKDALAKVTGAAKYAGDVMLPGLLHARILRPPAHGATLKDADTSAAEKIAGVRVVRQGSMIAVLHERRDVADKALELIKAQFQPAAPGPDDQTIFEHILKTGPKPTNVGEAGNLSEGEKASASIVEAAYLNSYVAHAPMEPHSATVNIENGKVTVWAGTQAPFTVKPAVAQALGIPQQNVRVIAGFPGGGFGGKSAAPQGVEAALLAKATGKPVQVVWSRAEEFFLDAFRPAAVIKIRSGLTSAGRISFWDFAVTGAGDRNAQHFYDIPHHRTTSSGGWMGGNPPGMHPFEVGAWRAPSVNSNTFARESHMDALAAKAGIDPVQFRLNHLSDKRMIRVLQTAASKFGWKPAKGPSGRGFGVSCGMYSGTYVATCAEVAVDKTNGNVQVKRIVLAQDQGVTVSPDGSRQQIEGCIIMGMGYALSEEVRFKDGAVLHTNFDSYEIPRFSWLPKIDITLIDNPGLAAQSCGEPPIINMGAVLANAIYDAAGARVLQLPMTSARVLAALKKA
jgi:nicotinate dehydrogenase subunit B